VPPVAGNERDDVAADPPVAAIDIGTNSFHLLVARPSGNNRFEVLDREKEVVRLGSGSGDMKRLEPDAIDRGVSALRGFRRIADAAGAEVHAVATSAVREATNRNEFLIRAYEEAGVRVEVVSGLEEARLIHLGVLQAVPVFEQRVLVVDIGGGSTEFVLGLGSELLDARSLKLGAIRLTDRFLVKEPVKRKAIDEARRFIRSYLPPAVRMIAAGGGFEVAVGSSGTILNVAEMARARAGDAPVRTRSNLSFTAEELAAVVDDLAARPTAEARAEVPGLDPRRADIILGGALVLEQAFAVLGIEEMVVSDFALREGILLDVLRRRHATSLGHLRDLRYESVLHLAGLTPGEKAHSERVAELALQLFEGTRDRHGLGEQYEELLEAAGLLCNVGLAISHDRHHLHSYYVIRNTDVLTGFTDHELELIALVARYHRKSAPKSRHPEFAHLSDDDQHVVRVLAGLLRVAVGLDRTRDGVVKGVEVEPDGKKAVRIVVDAAGDDAELELYSAESRKDLLEEALEVGIGLELRGGATPRPATPAPARPGTG
jgi:exopolyphosphatase / guanosine-5'-triphosphate,3'-diphosphate pyrophosphatase